MFAVPQKWWGEKMLLILSNTPISKHYRLCLNPCLQGVSLWNGLYELAMTDIDMQVRFGLKMVLECWDREFLGTTTIFQKN